MAGFGFLYSNSTLKNLKEGNLNAVIDTASRESGG